MINWLQFFISETCFMISFPTAKTILVSVLKSILMNSSHFTSSWRRINALSDVVYRTRTLKLFVLFVLYEQFFCLKDVAVEVSVVFAKAPYCCQQRRPCRRTRKGRGKLRHVISISSQYISFVNFQRKLSEFSGGFSNMASVSRYASQTCP